MESEMRIKQREFETDEYWKGFKVIQIHHPVPRKLKHILYFLWGFDFWYENIPLGKLLLVLNVFVWFWMVNGE